MNCKSGIENYSLCIKVTKDGIKSLKEVGMKVEFTKDGENSDVGFYKKGDVKDLPEKIANICIKRDKVAKPLKAKEDKKDVRE